MGSSTRAGVTQLVECDLAKVDVAGSNPVSRSNQSPFRVLILPAAIVAYPSKISTLQRA
jgi:hypothetical protein